MGLNFRAEEVECEQASLHDPPDGQPRDLSRPDLCPSVTKERLEARTSAPVECLLLVCLYLCLCLGQWVCLGYSQMPDGCEKNHEPDQSSC